MHSSIVKNALIHQQEKVILKDMKKIVKRKKMLGYYIFLFFAVTLPKSRGFPLRIHDERHGYKINIKGSPAHIKKQHKSTVSFNSRNIGDF